MQELIRIEVIRNGSKHTIERQGIDPTLIFEDIINILFASEVDIELLKKTILEIADTIKENHSNENISPL